MNNEVDIGRIREALRDRSRKLFGKLYRLEVFAAVGATPDPIWSRGMAQALDIAENQVAVELKVLTQLGALHPFPSAHDRRKLHQLVPHPVWDFVRALVEETIASLYPGEQEEALRAYWSAIGNGEEPRPLVVETSQRAPDGRGG